MQAQFAKQKILHLSTTEKKLKNANHEMLQLFAMQF